MTPDDTRGEVLTERIGHVLQITLHREARRNAIDAGLTQGLEAALDLLESDASLRAGVLTGGRRCFSAGSDLASPTGLRTERGGEYGITRRDRRKPLVAAIEGYALGGGLEIALACDLVVAARDAQLGLPEVRRGVLPTCGALFRALQALPPAVARELVLSGEPIDAVRAHGFGLVNRLAEPGGALDAALALAATIAGNAPLSVQACLAAMNAWSRAADEAGWAWTEQALSRIRGSEDVREGVRAFLEKRAPRWQGR